MKIMFFIGDMKRGGAERVISILANHYAQKNWQVEIVLLLDNRVNYELDKRIKIVNFSKKGSYIKNLFYWIFNIRKYVNKEKPDRIISFIGRINYLVLTATIGINIPIIVSERNDPKHDGRGRFLQFYGNFCYKLATAIIFQTNYEKLCFNKSLYGKSFIIANPVEVFCSPVSTFSKRLEVVTVGRLEKQKNQELLIKAFSIVSKEFPSLELKIYGEGSLRDKLQSLIEDYNLSDKVKLCGNVSDLHKRISESMLFVLTSEYEGLSNALIEAMMLGLPCITTDYPGSDEIIVDGQNGLIVPCNSIDILSQVIKKILLNNELRTRLSKNAIKKSTIYKKDIIIKKWEKVIER